MKICSFAVAVAVVVAVNGDSLQVASSLWEDAALRSQIAEAFTALVEASSATPRRRLARAAR